MIRKQTLLAVWVLLLAMAAQPAARAEGAAPAADELVPAQAVLVLNITQPRALLDTFLQPKLIEAVEASPAYKAAAAKPGFGQFQTVIKLLEARFGANWKTIVRRLVGGRLTWAVGPGGTSLLVVDALDAEAPKGLHEFLQVMVEADAKKKQQTDRIRSEKHGDVTIWSFGPNEAHAVIGKRWIVANHLDVLKTALNLRDGSSGKPITSVPGYTQALEAAGTDAAAALYLNTAILKQLPKVAKALSSKTNPLVALLAAPVTEALSKSSWLTVAVKTGKQAVTIEAISDGAVATSGVAKFALAAKSGDGAMPNLRVPRRIAAMSLYRDLRGFYAAKDTLFPERTSGLIFFENMMGIFFTGRDLADEVLAEMGPTVRLVVAGQKYDAAVGTPAVQLPAFALVVPLKNPKRFAPVVEEAWQKAVGLVNFTRGQKAEPGLIIDRPVHGGVKYTVAAFGPPTDKEKVVDMRFNFSPAIAVAHGHLILSSTDGLTRDVMDALGAEAAGSVKPLAAAHSLLEIDGTQLASILSANGETMIRGNMVDKGNTREQAESDINTLLTVVKTVKRLELAFGADKGLSKTSLTIHLNLPAGAKGGT